MSVAITETTEPRPPLTLVEGTRKCIDCKKKKLVSEMLPAAHIKRGHYLYCRDCARKRWSRDRRRRESGENNGAFQHIRKLPPYDELKRLYVDEGMTLSEIAVKYDCARSGVANTIKRRAVKAGEWPLLQPSDVGVRIARGSEDRRIKPDLIVASVFEVLDERAAELGKRRVTRRISEHGMTYEEAMTWVYLPHTRPRRYRHTRSPIGYEMHRFCERTGFSMSYLYDLRSGRTQWITKETARRLLEAIGEPVPDHVVNWRLPSKYRYRRPEVASG